MSQIITVVDGDDRKRQATGTYRNPVNVAEMIDWCSKHDRITFLTGVSRGTAYKWLNPKPEYK